MEARREHACAGSALVASPQPERDSGCGDCVNLIISVDFTLEADSAEETEAEGVSDGAKDAVALLTSGIAGCNAENR